MQTKTVSFIEVILGTFIGLGVAVVTQIVVFPWFGIAASIGQNLQIAGIFTVISIVRGYVVRRFFNWLERCLLHRDTAPRRQ